MSHKIQERPWESVRAEIFSPYNKHYFGVVDHHSKFLVMKEVKAFSTNCLRKTYKIFFSQDELPSKIASDVGTNSISESSNTSAKLST